MKYKVGDYAKDQHGDTWYCLESVTTKRNTGTYGWFCLSDLEEDYAIILSDFNQDSESNMLTNIQLGPALKLTEK